MDSNKILGLFFNGSMTPDGCMRNLDKLAQDTADGPARQEAARALCVLGLIRRVAQYQHGEASAQDLCLCLRDAVILLGRQRLPKALYELVGTQGSEYGLVCERDSTVSCYRQFPAWIGNSGFAEDVYKLKLDEYGMEEFGSVGDSKLTSCTRFRRYKSLEQKLAVHTALALPAGHTLLVSQPTGGGKSLVTQMLAASARGLTVVIVPTVALALDQYHAARTNLADDRELYCYRGGQSNEERVNIIRALRERRMRLLFTSPEAVLKNTELFGLLEQAAAEGYLENIVVDEAHVVPDWGTFFRPDFQIFSVVLRKWRGISDHQIRTYLLSATLSNDVVDTLFLLFGKEGYNAEFRCDALRREPKFYFHPTKTKLEQQEKILEAIRLLPKPMVVYVLEPREAAALQVRLGEIGYKNIPNFTGNTSDVRRDKILSAWKNSEYDLVIATSAFGIGVDKPNVRTILHACAPENLSRFYQEIGRGGRDGLPSLSLLLPYQGHQDGESDLRRAYGLVNGRVLRVNNIVNRWFGMLNSALDITAGTALLDSSATPPTMTLEQAEYAGNLNIAWNVNLLLFLHRTGFVSLEDVSYRVQNNSYLFSLKLLRPELLGDAERLTEALEEPRSRELTLQLDGHNAMSRLIQRPTSLCWGRMFKALFPLAKELCNGCPVHPMGQLSIDDHCRLRNDPELSAPPAPVHEWLQQLMGTYSTLFVHRAGGGEFDPEDVRRAIRGAEVCGLGAVVAPEQLVDQIVFGGLVLSYEEFYFAQRHTPYLFCRGALCLFGFHNEENYTLYQVIERMKPFRYRWLLYCDEDTIMPSTGKPVREASSVYRVDANDLLYGEAVSVP